MSFLQPWMIWGLPLVAIPILIHLINQRRYQTMPWGAMHYLLAASRMSAGYARVRQWLILAARTLAIAGLLFALARPLASGWLGMAAGNVTDTTLVLIDRSPSMHAEVAGTSQTKLELAVAQVTESLALLKSNHWVLIDSATLSPTELAQISDLPESPFVEPASSSADVPAMIQSAYEFLRENQSGRTDIWICSDLGESDWNREGGAWEALRSSFLELPQPVRFYLVAYPGQNVANIALRGTKAVRHNSGEGVGNQLLLSFTLRRQQASPQPVTIPVTVEIGAARTVVEVELTGNSAEVVDYAIALPRDAEQGWGRLSIPADANRADNEYYFVFDRQPPQRTVIVSDEPAPLRAIRLSAEIPSDPTQQAAVELLTRDKLVGLPWEEIALVIWHGTLPDREQMILLERFVARDGEVLFLPPTGGDSGEAFGLSWGEWTDHLDDTTVTSWRGDADLLANTISGGSLPLGKVQVRRSCELRGDFITLASVGEGLPLLVRVPTGRGGVYALATTSAANDSSLANDGVALYVAIQRAVREGAKRLGNSRDWPVGATYEGGVPWQPMAGTAEPLSTQYHHHAGVYQASPKLYSVNRRETEDLPTFLADDQVEPLFAGLDFARIDGAEVGGRAIFQEIWRLFLGLVIASLILESVLCIPRPRPAGESTS